MRATDIAKLQRRAIQLDGRPIPGVRMTEAQFEAWLPDNLRAEWVEGEVIMMSPANTEHVSLNGWLWHVIGGYVEYHDLGQVFGIEAQVRFRKLRRRRNPDLLFLSRRKASLIRPRYIDGAPDLIVEIVSPDSTSRDWRDKFAEYESAGVREYWIVDPSSRQVECYAFRAGKYRRLQEHDGRIDSKILRGFYLRPKWLFRSPRPKVATVLKELGAH